MKPVSVAKKQTQAPDRLAEAIVDKLNNPSTASDFDFHAGRIKSWQTLECQL